MATRQQLEQQLVAAHRTKNVQAAQQAAYAIRAYDQNVLSAQVPSINAPPPIDRVPKPTFGSWLENVTAGIGEGLGEQVQGLGGMIERGVTAFAQDPLKASAAAFMTALEPARQGFTQPVQAAKDVGTGIVETGKQMYQQATSGPIGLGQTMGQMIDLPGPSLPGGKRRPTTAELDVYHGTPHTFDPEEGAPLGRFRSQKIGTGEGAQVYGYGLYLAESPDVAGTYVAAGGARPSSAPDVYAADIVGMMGGKQKALKYLEGIVPPIGETTFSGESRELIESAINSVRNDSYKKTGRVYKVDLPDAKIEQMLDWDKPLSEQSDYVLERLGFHNKPRDYEAEAKAVPGTPEYARLEELMNTQVGGARVPDMTGEDFYRMRGGKDSDRSEYLRSLGIPGIKYRDAGSRGNFQVQNKYKGQNYGEAVSFKTEQQAKDYAAEQVAKGFEADIQSGTRNFVVFPGEEQSLTILERDGVKADVPKASKPKSNVSVSMKPQTNYLSAQSEYGNVGGHVEGNSLRISHAEVIEQQRGKGEGIKLYSALIDEALKNGLTVYSDSTVEASAVRMYEALKRRGYDVRRLEGGRLENGDVFGKGAKAPAFEIVAGPKGK